MITIEGLKKLGVNTEKALGRCMNKEDFYLKLVPTALNGPHVGELKAALAQKDLDKAFDCAHALKGVWGNLELTPLHERICEITELLRAKADADYDSLVKDLEERLAEFKSL